MVYSDICHDPKTRWDKNSATCVPCTVKPGYGITPNCGFDDNGGRHEPPYIKCKVNTFNDGSWSDCQPCATSCPPGSTVVQRCNLTADTQCHRTRDQTTRVPVKEPTTLLHVSSSTIQTNQGSSLTPDATTISTTLYRNSGAAASSSVLWAVPLAILISIALVMLSACIIYMKRKRGQHLVFGYSRRSSVISDGFSPLSSPACNDVKDILSSEILSAPLQTVLDNLDVLEQLIILLDPDGLAVKNTKHLASHCSFSSSWITYTYSMKDSKSPLKAVLEGVTSRHPDWTVGHLAKLLRQMERNDAILVLAELKLNEMAV